MTPVGLRACAAPATHEHACASCLRRSALLASIGARLELRSRLRGRLFELLALGDDELLAAVGGSPLARTAMLAPTGDAEPICRHDSRYPVSLTDDGAPRLLYVRGGIPRLATLGSSAAVAISGSTLGTDYGTELAASIARELAAHGVTIVSGLVDGVGAAAQREAAAAGAGAVAVLAGGHRAGVPARRRALAQQISAQGCLVAELPDDCGGRVWGRIAAARVLARLSALTLVVEADDTPVDLSVPEVAKSLGRTLAVVPGRVTSPASRGAHRLLIDGAHLARGAGDVLALLSSAGGQAPSPSSARERCLDPALRTVLELVGAGSDTPEKLERDGASAEHVLLALSRLELLGLLARGDGGRYVVRGGAIDV